MSRIMFLSQEPDKLKKQYKKEIKKYFITKVINKNFEIFLFFLLD